MTFSIWEKGDYSESDHKIAFVYISKEDIFLALNIAELAIRMVNEFERKVFSSNKI